MLVTRVRQAAGIDNRRAPRLKGRAVKFLTQFCLPQENTVAAREPLVRARTSGSRRFFEAEANAR